MSVVTTVGGFFASAFVANAILRMMPKEWKYEDED